MSNYPNRIRELRKMQNKSGVKVAEFLGITPQFLYNIEKGDRTLTSDVAAKLAEYFGVTVDYILGIDTNENNNHPREFPEWATKNDIADFKKMLENDQPVLFDGVPIEGEKRQRVMDILSGLFWEAKELNKETYGRKEDKKNSDHKE
ncbi:helix-turn-helix transcriptional regulator [Paenibacillus sp. UMB7766-LJ446]|uniref:helix-turn-helix domain-containing protein n=1 Tax=Paenibacillus sp. UMB7766-LJ446 TaxID=3046313 RepID=UPI00254A0A15|nr:helix-turn-helix transcriptional regulator [Paenibacillus sp. UMB7766-LJ446]MDK8188830.1 helix-turn-helix transcriptional regulator [Paenibacillus sp. UMB7766-LJ446]